MADVAGIISVLAQYGVTVAVAESLTGGALCSRLIDIPGASKVVRGGIVAYDTEAKARLLGVDAELLARVGAVDADVATQMARGVRVALTTSAGPADIGIATTGVAGPDPQDGQPVGTTYVAVAVGEAVSVRGFTFEADRAGIRQAAVDTALGLLEEVIASAMQ